MLQAMMLYEHIRKKEISNDTVFLKNIKIFFKGNGSR